MPHHSSPYYVDAPLATDGIVWSVTIVSLQNSSTDRDAVWDVDLGGL